MTVAFIAEYRQTSVSRAALKRLGISEEEYLRRKAAGEKWCTKCKTWHPVQDFHSDASRFDGLSSMCRKAHKAEASSRQRRRDSPQDVERESSQPQSCLSKQLRAALRRLTPEQRTRYEQLLAGRVSESMRGPMKITDTIRLETAEMVLLESELQGACCASCRDKAARKTEPRAEAAREVVSSLANWEGRKLNAEELRERMRQLRARSPLVLMASTAQGD